MKQRKKDCRKNISIQLSIEFISYLTHIYFVPNLAGIVKHKQAIGKSMRQKNKKKVSFF